MKPYELVVVLKASLPADEKKSLLTSLEGILGSTIQLVDDIGVVPAAYPLEGKKENSNVHLVSYYLHADPKDIIVYTKKFEYLQGLIRHFFYAMDKNEAFITYADTHKKLEVLITPKS